MARPSRKQATPRRAGRFVQGCDLVRVQVRHMTLEPIVPLSDDPTVSLPSLVVLPGSQTCPGPPLLYHAVRHDPARRVCGLRGGAASDACECAVAGRFSSSLKPSCSTVAASRPKPTPNRLLSYVEPRGPPGIEAGTVTSGVFQPDLPLDNGLSRPPQPVTYTNGGGAGSRKPA